MSSPGIIPPELYRRTGFAIARRTIARIKGAVATHLASGAMLPIAEDLIRTGTAGVGVSVHEDLAEIKRVCRGRLNVIGNLNGIEMRRWSEAEAEAAVKAAIAAAGPGGGFILSDNHGELPLQVPDEILAAIARAVQKWGRYPLDWIGADG